MSTSTRITSVGGAVLFWLAGMAGGVSRSEAQQPGGRAPHVRVEWSERVSVDAPDEMHVETWLAANPRDPNHLIATAMIPARRASVIYLSREGGRRWVRAADANAGSRTFPDMDPVLEFSPDGIPFFSTLADGFTVWRGDDGGASWNRLGIVPGGSYDRQWLGFDASGGRRHGRLYTGGKVPIQVLGSPARDVAAVSWSDDGGRTFRQARLVLPDPADGAMNVLSHMIVLGDGSLVAAYQFFRWNQTGRAGLIEGEMRTMRSRDGREWEGPFSAGPLRVYGNRGDESLMVKGLGGGRLAVRPGAAGGPLHLVWVNEVDGFLQIVLTTSPDGGRTWREPVLVNDGGRRAHHSNPGIAVNAAGDVAVTWNDRRDDPTDRCFRPYVAVLVDAGRSVPPNIPVDRQPVCPPPGRWLNGGDTQGLVARPDGSFQALWIGPGERRADALQLWTSRIAVRAR